MAGHFVAFAAFLMEPYPGPAALLKIILYSQRDDCTDAGERIPHQPEQAWSRRPTDEFARIDRLQIANHESPRTTKLYDRTREELTFEEVERIKI